ncbi:hypothetical protein BGW38_000130 [Lunasporangiospora selenospora]|uniref:Mitochondrial carrier n=1 Tax=Lunasporangiospora selenospora TaxID=979761 RepID=A0A9P6FW60_9FUNG|nr:hypothetical protein BGW38_000130 [Lunasporangiospora selenospora]
MASSVNDFIAGYISGVAGLIIGSPLDVLKVRLQSDGHAKASRGTAAANKNNLSTMIRDEGVKSLFKGITSPIIGLAGLNSILFASYSATMRFLETMTPPLNALHHDPYSTTTAAAAVVAAQPLSHVFTAGFVAGVACFLVSTPTELVKCRAQVIAASLDPNSSAAAQRAILGESGSWKVTKDVVRRFGFKGLYQGGWVTILRDAPGYGVYFLSYEGLKRFLEVPPGDTSGINTWKLLFAGGLAGTLSWANVIKTRLQTQPHLMSTKALLTKTLPTTTTAAAAAAAAREPTPTTALLSSKSRLESHARGGLVHQTTRQGHSQVSSNVPYRGIVDCAIRSYKSEGFGVFFKGVTPALLRAFPVNAVTFFVYELVMEELQKLEGRS